MPGVAGVADIPGMPGVVLAFGAKVTDGGAWAAGLDPEHADSSRMAAAVIAPAGSAVSGR
jgi:hypothetical protein